MPSLRLGDEEKALPSSAMGGSWLRQPVAFSMSFQEGMSEVDALSDETGLLTTALRVTNDRASPGIPTRIVAARSKADVSIV